MEVERNFKVAEGDDTEVEFSFLDDAEVRKTNQVALEAILEGFGQEAFIKTFLNHDINMRNLSLLTDEDLQILGVTGESIRAEMLKEFAKLPNQVPGYDDLIKEIDRDSYNTESMKTIISHLHTLKDSAYSSYLKLYLENPNDIPIGDHSFASSYVIKTLNEIIRHAQEMDNDLIKLQETYNRMNLPKKKSLGHLKTLGSVAGVLLAGYCLYKLTTSKASLAKLTDYLLPFLENQMVAPQAW